MDYETKLILERLIDAINNNSIDSEQLIEAISKPESPDWWSVIATIFAAIVAAVITYVFGKRQEKIQQQQVQLQAEQNRQQEYNLYRNLYKLFWIVHNTADSFVFKVYSNIAIEEFAIYTWDRLRNDIQQLQNELEDKTIDIQLKFPEEVYRCEQYKFLLTLMLGTINRIEALEKAKQVCVSNKMSINEILENLSKNDNNLINIIRSSIKDGKDKNDFISSLISVPILKKEVCSSAFLDKIKAKI